MYKATHRVGQLESFNVWVNQAAGYLGYATTTDGVVLLNDLVSSIVSSYDVHNS